MKKSFVLHLDSLCVLDKLTDEQAGKLFKAITAYNKGEELPPLDFALEIAFMSFENQFKRDAEKYNNTTERNKANGKKGGRPKKTQLVNSETQHNPKNPVGYLETQHNPTEPKKADSDSDSDSDKDSDSDFLKENKKLKIEINKLKSKGKNNNLETARAFYDKEIEKANGDENYNILVKFLFGEYATSTTTKQVHENVLKMKNQLSFEDFNKLMLLKPKDIKVLTSIQTLNDGKEKNGSKYSRHAGIFTTIKSWYDRDKRQKTAV